MGNLLFKDIRVAFRNPKGWIISIIFFVLFLSMFAIAQNNDQNILNKTASSVIWLGLIFSMIIMFESIFDRDLGNGQFDQIILAGVSPHEIVISKIIAGYIFSAVPLIITIPVAALFFQLPMAESAAIMISILIGAPAIIAYCVTAAALLAGQGGKGFVMSLIVLPFLVPVLIFALAGIEAYPEQGIWNTGFQAVSGISIIALTLGIPASASALITKMD